MKRAALALVLVTAGLFAHAQVKLPEHYPIAGTWSESGGRLYQNDEKARLAKVNIPVVQNSPAMLYEFDARYEGGAEDGHGGFGLHLFVDAALSSESWGAGHSYLLWLNYDKNPRDKNIQPGLSAQIYRSYSNSWMELVESFDLNKYVPLLTEETLAKPIHFKIIADANTGEIRIYNPADNNNSYYILNMDKRVLPIKGDWIVLRTNGIKMSFASSEFE